ncbi:MAG: hypothetical protein WB791_03365 [Waddliaceae bacterium]
MFKSVFTRVSDNKHQRLFGLFFPLESCRFGNRSATIARDAKLQKRKKMLAGPFALFVQNTRLLAFFFLAFFGWGIVFADDQRSEQIGPIHEAFVARITENTPLEAIPIKPPLQADENIPQQLDMQAEWISGYWSWDSRLDDFIWVSGVWRRPPPGHQWIAGFWMESSTGWAWVPGYWSRVSASPPEYIGLPPPDPIDENAFPPQSTTNASIWVPGYWHFLSDQKDYCWIPGSWEELDPDWVLVPAHYTWRSRGYVFVPAYWDWSLEGRGRAYSNVVVESSCRRRISVEPDSVMQTADIIKKLLLEYPDYRCFFFHHRLTHPRFWQEFHSTPPWWEWETWWCHTRHDHWSLWWWYTHPGYPQPCWITEELAGRIPPPLRELRAMFQMLPSLAMITPDGVVKGGDLLLAMRKRSEGNDPILPVNPKRKEKVFALAAAKHPPVAEILEPMGNRLPIDPLARRPQIRKSAVDGRAVADVSEVPIDLPPALPDKPKIPSHNGQGIWPSAPLSQDSLTYTAPARRPIWTPKTAQFSQSLNKSIMSLKREKKESLPLAASRIERPHSRWIEVKKSESVSISSPSHLADKEGN